MPRKRFVPQRRSGPVSARCPVSGAHILAMKVADEFRAAMRSRNRFETIVVGHLANDPYLYDEQVSLLSDMPPARPTPEGSDDVLERLERMERGVIS